jgi:chromosome segregation protein
LSGGERSLTSIALLCSLLSCFPSPFVVLDEVDAALDEANTIRFGQILGTLSHQTQFITITHNRETMSQSNAIYGVTMGDDGISKLLSIKFDQATVFAK